MCNHVDTLATNLHADDVLMCESSRLTQYVNVFYVFCVLPARTSCHASDVVCRKRSTSFLPVCGRLSDSATSGPSTSWLTRGVVSTFDDDYGRQLHQPTNTSTTSTTMMTTRSRHSSSTLEPVGVLYNCVVGIGLYRGKLYVRKLLNKRRFYIMLGLNSS